MKRACLSILALVAATQLFAQEPQPRRVTQAQWDAITAAERAPRFDEAATLQERIITDTAVDARDRVTALTAYAGHAGKQRPGADALQAAAWAETLEQAPDLDAGLFKELVKLQLTLAEAARDAARKAGVLKRAAAAERLAMRDRSAYAGELAKHHLLQTDDIPGGAKLIRALLDVPGLADRDLVFVCKALGDYWMLAGNLEEAVAAYSLIYERAPGLSASATDFVREAYRAFGEPEKAREHFLKHADTLAKAREDRELALKLIDDEATDLSLRKELFKLFLGNNPEDAAVRAKHAGLYADKTLNLRLNLFGGDTRYGTGYDGSPGLGSYTYILELLGYSENTRSAGSAEWILLKVKALAGLNREGEARELIEAFLARPGAQAKPLERHLLALVAAVIGLPDKAGVAKAAIEAASRASEPGAALTSAERATTLATLASVVSHTRKHDLTRDIYACYEACFVPQPRKAVTAPFFDEPVGGIDAFLRIRDRVKPERLDRRFKGDLEMIVATDIASGGERAAALGAAEQNDASGRLYVLCDAEGLHFFFDIPDPDGLALGAGIAGRSHTFEVYFAPGWNQPYLSAGVRFGARTGSWFYQTTYNNLVHQRFEEGSPHYRTDVRYYDKGFYASFFFGWDAMFDKLPDTTEKFCEFDTIDWSPNGGLAWSSRLNVHSRLEWGRVHFDFTPEQLDAIRKRIIFNARREYLAERDRPNGPVDFWKDEVLGDPAFYAASIQPLVARLDAYLPEVTTTMSAGTVDRLFREAVPGWKRLRFFVSALRAETLETRLTAE